MDIPQKIKNRTTIGYLKEIKLVSVPPPKHTAALFTIVKIWKPHECPLTDEWIEKMLYIYMSMRKKKILTFLTTWMDLKALCK